MRLRSLEIQGFKSFPDKTTLTFEGGITAVVGPNGSGKSNIADAVRWVLGEQSTKTLRGAKMEDVIFGGTQTRKPVGYAMVQLTIDNADKALPMEEDLITITRRLYRSGESEYRLGGTMVRLKDIHELLMDTGLGRDGYSIIGQGRIAEIVGNKSSQRREIFEEAAGIAKFRYRKEEAEKRLNQAEENLLRLRDILVELEDRVGPLKIQAEKARAFLAYSEEKKSLEISLWMLSLAALKEQLASQQDKLYLCKNQYEELEGEAEGIQEKIENIYAQSQELSAAVEQKRAEIRSVEDSMAKSESEAAVLENDIRHNNLSIQRLEGELATAGLDAEELQGRIALKEAEQGEGAKALTAMEGRLEAAEQRLADQREQAARVTDELLSLTVRQTSLSDAIGEARLSKAQSATLIQESRNRVEALRQSGAAVGSAVEELKQNLVECDRQLEEEQDKIDSLGNTQKGYALKRESRAARLEDLRKKAQELENQAGQRLQRAKLLEDLEANMEGFQGSVKYILGEAKKGALGGVHGAVSSIIDTEKKYAVAIETALGAAMQNIVVADEGVAKRAIRILQTAKAGRATFLPLTSVRGGRDLDVGEMRRHEGFIGTGASLVKYEARFAGIVSQLLGRVAVVEDLDAGTEIAKASGYRFRIVTLDGQVINAGGSFTGGSTGRSAGVLGRRHEIDALKEQAAKLRADAEALGPDIKAVSEEIAGLDAYISGAASELKTAQEEKVRLGFARETIVKNLAQAEQNAKLAEKELEALSERLEELQGSDADSAQLMEELEAQLTELRERIESTTTRRDTLNVGTETAAQSLNEQKMAFLEARKDQDGLDQELGRMREQAESAGTRTGQLTAEIAELTAANEAIAAQIAALGEQKSDQKTQVEAMNALIAERMAQRTALEAETTALRNQEREVAGNRENVSRELARLEERRNAIQGEYDGIIAKLWDEYELTRSKAMEIAVELDDKDKAGRRLTELRGKIKAIGTVNVDAVEEYAQVSERYEFLSAQVKDVEDSKAQLQKLIGELTQEMRDQFSESFNQIAQHFSRIFVQLFGGGKGELTLTQEEDVLESGVEIYVQPPGKIIKNLSLLSGGEQAFVAIAIYFAILKVRPAPFCLLDEIEAALDDVNVVKFANYLRQMCDKTQFIAITHRRGTMEEADVLYGVTMQDEGVSKLLELNVSEVEEKLGI